MEKDPLGIGQGEEQVSPQPEAATPLVEDGTLALDGIQLDGGQAVKDPLPEPSEAGENHSSKGEGQPILDSQNPIAADGQKEPMDSPAGLENPESPDARDATDGDTQLLASEVPADLEADLEPYVSPDIKASGQDAEPDDPAEVPAVEADEPAEGVAAEADEPAEEAAKEEAKEAPPSDPRPLLRRLMDESYPVREEDENLSDVEDGLSFFLKLYLEGLGDKEPPPFHYSQLDSVISGLDDALSRQMDSILHSEPFQELEKVWLSLKFMVDRVNYDENIITEILNVTKEELFYDLVESPDINRTLIYGMAYTREYGQFGGKPYAALVGLYDFSVNPQDLLMLKSMSVLGNLAHTPFLGSASKDFFGFKNWGELGYVTDFQYILDEPRFAAFREMRTKESSRYLCLVLPGFLARLPYSPITNPVDSWNYSESTRNSDTDYAWGYPQILLALKMAESFAQYRWCVNITGLDGGGRVEGLPALEYEAMGSVQRRISTQAIVGEKLEFQLSQGGFIPLCDKDNKGVATFYNANTLLRPKTFMGAENSQESLNYRISTMLPYMMIINRLAHYIKIIQRENIGSWKDSRTLQKELNSWINQYVTDMDSPSPSIRAKRPLRFAKVDVREDPDNPGWHIMNLSITPHFKFIGASFTLNLTGRLDQVQFEGS